MNAPDPKEIRECYSDYLSEWQETRDEAETDMRFITGDPWSADDRKDREENGRPCLSLDELNQYLNQYVNNLRQARRAIKATPKGEGANQQGAEKRSALIKGIEEHSNAQGAYISAGENAAQRSYGFAVIRTDYRDDKSFDQDIWIKPILNPDTILISPNYKEPDASDIEDGFILDYIARTKFEEKYPNAKITDFGDDLLRQDGVSAWVKDKHIQIAEYWKISQESTKLLLVEPHPGGPLVIFKEDEWKKSGKEGLVKRERRVDSPKVMQYLTNGVEILDEIPWAGSRIPIISCFGKELWMTEGGKAKRKLLSMIRLARDPQMLFAFLATQECEEAGMVPKVPFVGAVGQFETDKETWEELNKVPHAFAQYDVVIDGASGSAIPPPQRPQWMPNFQQYELAKDSARRSIQAAMGITPLPTAAQRSNEKSGLALEKIQNQEQIGSFHFTDNFDRFMHNLGWQVNELITPIIDTPRDMPISNPDGTRTTMHVVGNTSHPIDDAGKYEVQGLPENHMHTGQGDYDGVTISTGPSFDSERDEQAGLADTLLQNLNSLPIPPAVAQKILAMAIKMKNVGSFGDEIATLLNPPDPNGLPPQAQAVITNMQAQMQQLQQENTALHMDRAGRVLEQQTKVHLQQLKGQQALDTKTVDFITQIVKAELAKGSKADTTKAQLDANKELTTLGFDHDQIDRAHQSAHEVAMSGLQHDRSKELAQQASDAAAEQQQAAAAQGGQPGGDAGAEPAGDAPTGQ